MRGRWSAAATMFGDLALRRYPAFVYGRARRPEELPPVFCFHGVRAKPFAVLLKRLARDGYRTLTCDQWYERCHRRVPTDAREVLLTFDDAVASMWTIATPLLERFDMNGVTFVIPARVQHAPAGPTLEDAEAGRITLEELEKRDQGDQPLATWDELRAMHQRGVWDLQSHGLTHRRVFTNLRLLGFVTPQRIAASQPNDMAFDVPGDRSYAWPALGTPLYASDSRLSDALAVQPNDAARLACVARVQAEGDAAFLARPDAEKLLRTTLEAHALRREAVVETPAQRDAAILRELNESKAILQANVPGIRVTDLALPWAVGGEAVVRLAEQAGYRAVHWGRVDRRVVNHRGGDPLRIARVGEAFAALLPGEGRTPLRSWVFNKGCGTG